VLRPVVADRSRVRGAEAALERLGGEIRRGLDGRRVVTSAVHGDLCPANVLMSPDGAKVTGLIDWESGRKRGLPDLDLLHLEITTRMSANGHELGQVVRELLADGERRDRTRLLLTWLHHVARNVAKSRRYARSRFWVRRNIDPILALSTAVSTAGTATAPRLALPKTADAELVAPIAGLSLSVVLWIVSLAHIEPRAMTDVGLMAVLPVTFYAALFVLTASFIALVQRGRRRAGLTPLLSAHVLALIAFLHATPAIVYGTLRYPWAWKHVGIVDYIDRHGSVMPGIDQLSVYHNWPGFFSFNSLLAEFPGLGDTIELATWAPLIFNVLTFGALVFVFSALTREWRIVWLGSWLFFIANWVGQDYFSPQAFAFVLYLVVLGVVLRWLGPSKADGRRDRVTAPTATAFVVLLLVVIASSHALTSVMVTLALAALVLAGACAVRGLPLISAAIVALWAVLFAHEAIFGGQGQSMLETIRFPWTQAESNLTPVGQLSDGQQLVAMIARGLVVAIGALAALAALGQHKAGNLDRRVVILALAPLLLFAGGSYDGEILFRIYLFSVPFLAFLAAHVLVPRAGRISRSWRPAIGSIAACTVLLGAFLFAYYGKERVNYFTAAEVKASEYLYSHAPPGALLIDGTTNYPRQFRDYEQFEYLTLAEEPSESRARVLARPERVLDEWMSDKDVNGAFLIITRSQKAEVSDQGVMPRSSLGRIQDALLSSPRFRLVYQNRDATIFSTASTDGGGSA
jgi:Phosphotransferase enzyme family